MHSEAHRQAFAARDAYEAMLELKSLIDDAAKRTFAAEVELFRAALTRNEKHGAINCLRQVVGSVQSRDFDGALFVIREKLELALSAEDEVVRFSPD